MVTVQRQKRYQLHLLVSFSPAVILPVLVLPVGGGSPVHLALVRVFR